MKIIMLTSVPVPPSCGIGNYIVNLSKKLMKNGDEVLIITRGGLTQEFDYYYDIPVLRVPFIKIWPFHVDIHRLFVKKVINDFHDFDVLHYHTPIPPPVHPGNVKKIVTTFHSSLVTSWRLEFVSYLSFFYRSFGILSKHLEQKLIDYSDVITAVSPSVAKEVSHIYGLNIENIEVVANAPNDIFFINNDLSLKSSDEDVLLYVGRLSYGKGLLELLDSVKYMLNEKPDIKLILVGSGQFRSTLERKVARLSLENNVLFYGFVENKELPSLYSSASVFVAPSIKEGLPTTVLEAMASGVPVVGNHVPGIYDIVDNGVTGILVKSKRYEVFAESILKVLNDKDLQDRFSFNAKEKISKYYTWDKISRKFMEIYNV